MKRFCVLMIIFCFLFCCFDLVLAATYDISGPVSFQTSDDWNNCGDSTGSEAGIAVISQTGDTFTVEVLSNTFSGGTIDGNFYTISGSYEDGDGITSETISFTLDSATSGSGSGSWTWVSGEYSCQGGYNFNIQKPASAGGGYDASGAWTVKITDSQADCPEDAPSGTYTVVIKQVAGLFEVTIEGDTYLGEVDDNVYTASASYPDEDGTTTEIITFTLDSATSGSGSGSWTWSDGQNSCSGEYTFTVAKQDKSSGGGGGGGGGGPCFILTLF